MTLASRAPEVRTLRSHFEMCSAATFARSMETFENRCLT